MLILVLTLFPLTAIAGEKVSGTTFYVKSSYRKTDIPHSDAGAYSMKAGENFVVYVT